MCSGLGMDVNLEAIVPGTMSSDKFQCYEPGTGISKNARRCMESLRQRCATGGSSNVCEIFELFDFSQKTYIANKNFESIDYCENKKSWKSFPCELL